MGMGTAGGSYVPFKYLKITDNDLARASKSDRLVLENVALVGHFVGKFMTFSNLSRDDLFQAGLEGLVRAAQMFDPNRNIKFSSYALVAIQNSIWSLVDIAAYQVKVTYRTAMKIADLNRFIEQFHHEHHKEPSIRDISSFIDTDVDTAQMLYTLSKHVKVDINDCHDDALFANNLVSYESQNYDNSYLYMNYMEELYDVISRLPSIEGAVLLLRLGLYDTIGYSAAEVGYVFELPPGRIRDIEYEALLHLRNDNLLSSYADMNKMTPWELICIKLQEKGQKDLTILGIPNNIYSIDNIFGDNLMSGNFEIKNDELLFTGKESDRLMTVKRSQELIIKDVKYGNKTKSKSKCKKKRKK